MSITRFVTGIFSLAAAALLLAAPAAGQREIHHVPPLIHPDGENPDLVQPFIHPLTFNPDFQFFAPADYSLFGGGPEANTGFFASYDRLYIYVTRPEDQLAPNVIRTSTDTQTLGDEKAGDFTWGNRFDLGYMTEEDHGWLTSFWHIDGPNHFDILLVERIDVFNEDDDDDPNTPVFPARDENNPFTGARDFRVDNSVNVADLTSWEFNKTFRLKSLHYGSVVEPFFGFRYMKFQDFYSRDQYERRNEITGGFLGPGVPIPPTDIDEFTIEELTESYARFDNHMVGGQIGMRWFKQKQRWNLSSEIRAFAFQNFQTFESRTDFERWYYDDVGQGAEPITVVMSRDRAAGHASEFVFGTEIRAEAAYAVTRDIWLRAGAAFMEFGRGIGRGNDLGRNDQDVTMVGATFGVTVNR